MEATTTAADAAKSVRWRVRIGCMSVQRATIATPRSSRIERKLGQCVVCRDGLGMCTWRLGNHGWMMDGNWMERVDEAARWDDKEVGGVA